MDKLIAFWHFVVAHPALVGWCIAAYALAAGAINRSIWPKPNSPPASRFLVVLHFIFIDWPAAQAAKGAQGQGIVLHAFGLEIPVPFLSWSQLLQGPPRLASTVSSQRGAARLDLLAIIAFVGLLAVALSGCAGGADGLRQACTNADRLIEGGYQTVGRAYQLDQEQLRAKLTAKTIAVAQAETTLTQHKTLVDKVLLGLDGSKAAKTALCLLIPAVEAGQRKDVADLIAQVTGIATGVQATVAAVAALIPDNSHAVLTEPSRVYLAAFILRRRSEVL